MTVAGIDLIMARREAEAGMPDFCVIGVEVQSTVLDEETGTYPMVVSDPVYNGPCQLMSGTTANHVSDYAGALVVETGSVLKLPVKGSEGVLTNMIAVISTGTYDLAQINTRLRVTGPYKKSYAASRRFAVEEVT